MALVFVPSQMQALTNGQARVDVEGTNGKQIIENLDKLHSGFINRLLDEGNLKPSISIAVDGDIITMGLIEKVHPNSEVHFLPAISGGN